MTILKTSKRIGLISIFIGLISTNILSITNASFHDLLAGLLSKLPSHTELMSQSKTSKFKQLANKNKTLQKQNKSLQKQNNAFSQKTKLRRNKLIKAQAISRRIAFRTARNVGMNVGSVFGSAIPYLGIGTLLAVTGADVYSGCKTMNDTNELLRLFDANELKSEEHNVCGMKVPTMDQVIKQVTRKINISKQEFNDAVGGTISVIKNTYFD